jgi:hypothetical protein
MKRSGGAALFIGRADLLMLQAKSFAAAVWIAAVAVGQGPILINEVHCLGTGAVPPLQGDYVELWNTSPQPIFLAGWTLGTWSGNAGTLTQRVLTAPMVIEGYCYLVLQEGGVAGAAISDPNLPPGTRGYRLGGTLPWPSNASAGAFLKDPAGVNSDYVYLHRGLTTTIPTAPPHLASAGTGAAWTIGSLATSGVGLGHLKRAVNLDGNVIGDWSHDASANVGTPGAPNTSGGATQTALGPCSGLDNVDFCVFGQPNTPQARLVVSGVDGPLFPSTVDLYADNEFMTFVVTGSPAVSLGATVLLALSSNCNVGHIVDEAGRRFDLGHSALAFCDVSYSSPLGFGNPCLGLPVNAFGVLGDDGRAEISVPLGGIAFPRMYVQGIIVDPLGGPALYTGAAGIEALPGRRHRASGGLPLAIPDGIGAGPGASVVHDLVIAAAEVPPGLTIADLDVQLQLTHTWGGDLNITLAKVGTTIVVPLMTAATPDVNADLSGLYRLSDEAAATLDSGLAAAVGAAVAPGAWRADGLLSAFDGQGLVGTWRLTLADHHAVDTGQLLGWALVVNGIH